MNSEQLRIYENVGNEGKKRWVVFGNGGKGGVGFGKGGSVGLGNVGMIGN